MRTRGGESLPACAAYGSFEGATLLSDLLRLKGLASHWQREARAGRAQEARLEEKSLRVELRCDGKVSTCEGNSTTAGARQSSVGPRSATCTPSAVQPPLAVSPVRSRRPAKRGNEPPKRQLSRHEAQEDGDEEPGVVGHDGEHDEVGDQGLQAKEERAREVDGEEEGGRVQGLDARASSVGR